MNWNLARRAEKMNPSVIREILKVTEKPGIISFAGGLPSPLTFPIDAMREASERVLKDDGKAALQYAASEGYGPLREWVAQDLRKQGMSVSPDQVLITTGSQQGLDLLAKILIDAGSRILVETPTYLGALQAFLERGFDTFREMRGADEFLRTVATRERALAARLFAGEDAPTRTPIPPVAGAGVQAHEAPRPGRAARWA